MKNKRSNIINLGCRLNTYEGEVIKKLILKHNIQDYTIINSCAVTQEAEKKVQYEIRRAKKINPLNKIIVTGCAAQIDPEKYNRLSNVDLVIGNNEKMDESIWKNIDYLNSVSVEDIFKSTSNHKHLIEKS